MDVHIIYCVLNYPCLMNIIYYFLVAGSNELPTVHTIDTYMSKLHGLIMDTANPNPSLMYTVKEIVSHLDFSA